MLLPHFWILYKTLLILYPGALPAAPLPAQGEEEGLEPPTPGSQQKLNHFAVNVLVVKVGFEPTKFTF